VAVRNFEWQFGGNLVHRKGREEGEEWYEMESDERDEDISRWRMERRTEVLERETGMRMDSISDSL
jgi:hypothetical protein